MEAHAPATGLRRLARPRRRDQRGAVRPGPLPALGQRHVRRRPRPGAGRHRRGPERSTMSVVVTGGAGFIGANLCRELVSRGAEVVVIDDLSTGSAANLDGVGARLVEGSIL